jgi:hypothetical protein
VLRHAGRSSEWRSFVLTVASEAHSVEDNVYIGVIAWRYHMEALLLAPSVPVRRRGGRRGDLAVRPFVSPAASRTLVLAWRKGSPLRAGLKEVAAAITAVMKTSHRAHP